MLEQKVRSHGIAEALSDSQCLFLRRPTHCQQNCPHATSPSKHRDGPNLHAGGDVCAIKLTTYLQSIRSEQCDGSWCKSVANTGESASSPSCRKEANPKRFASPASARLHTYVPNWLEVFV